MEKFLEIALGSCCLLALIGGGALALYMRAVEKRIVRDGQTLFAPLVQANSLLFDPGKEDLPAQVLISFDSDTPELRRRLLDIADAVAALKTREAETADEQVVAEIVQNETPRWGRRHRLPDSFTGGLNVFAAPVTIERKKLPGRCLQRKFIFCRGLPGVEGEIVMISDEEVDSFSRGD